MNITVFVDADHAGDRATCRSFTGILIYVDRAPTIWFSKKQNTVETSTFGSVFVAVIFFATQILKTHMTRRLYFTSVLSLRARL